MLTNSSVIASHVTSELKENDDEFSGVKARILPTEIRIKIR